ncbi:threonine synthase [Mariniluteicoccus flavus]
MPHLIDRSGHAYPLDHTRWRGDDGSPLMFDDLPGITRDEVDLRTRSVWRYRAALPDAFNREVSLGEGLTPLVPTRVDGDELLFKLDYCNPTGSFKDRGVSTMITALASAGQAEALEDSSGNGGSSFAAYAAAAGIDARVLVPQGTSPAKIGQTRAHGAEIQIVPGTRDDCSAEALRQAESRAYASHNWHPMFLQGVKTQAYEIWEDLDFTAPDTVVLVAGSGSQVIAHDLAWHELQRSGAIPQIPRLVMVQPENCCPLVRAFEVGADDVNSSTGSEGGWKPTMAEGTAIGRPVRDREVLAALRRCDGLAVACAEDEIAAATRTLASRGLYAEPTSANAYAGYRRLRESGALDGSGTTIVVLTGSGHKSAARMAEVFGED